MNNVVNYSLIQTQCSNEINYQIIHVPTCESWAKELLVDFLIHKTAFCLNSTTVDRLKPTIKEPIILKEGEGKKQYQQIKERNKYINQLSEICERLNIPIGDKKSLIIVKRQDLIIKKLDKNPWVSEFFSEDIFANNHNLIVSTIATAYDLENQIKGEESIPTIENIFIFQSQNQGGMINLYSRNQLERLNRYGLGIKSCVVFSLSEKPFRLYHTIDIKNRLSSTILQRKIDKYDEFDGFITFTQAEVDYLFVREPNQKVIVIDCPERTTFTQEIDQFIDTVTSNLKYRTELSISFSDELQDIWSQNIANKIADFSKDLCTNFFTLLRQIWDNDIRNQIDSFICNSSTVGFVLPKDTSKLVKSSLSHLFSENNHSIKYFSFYDLKQGIDVDRLIILQYRSANGYYKPYPNSFDPLPIKANQSSLIIINRLTHDNYYEWDNYWYHKAKNRLLFSKLRREILNWEILQTQRPTSPNVKDYIEEAENEARIYETDKCKIYYKGRRQPKECLACERVIYEENSSRCIAELRDISDLKDISIQMMDDIVEQVKSIILKKSEENTNAEKIIRNNPKFNLSETEINSSTELWQFLLKREVKNNGEQAVYAATFSKIPKDERVSLNTFNQWYNLEKSIILPRSRKDTNALLTHLGFDTNSAYHHIIIKKKSSNINDTRLLNSQIEALLRKSLFKTINENDFNMLKESHSDIFIILDIKNIGDLDALTGLLEISLTPIDHIEYEHDQD